MIDLRLLVKAGVHFGHQSSRWSPKMEPYIWGVRNGVHLIDVSKTAFQLERAGKFLESVISEGKTVLWIGTKKPAQATMKEAALLCGMPYVTHRWIGGTLTNFPQVKKSVTKYLHYKDIIAKANTLHYTKKEFNVFQKIVDRLEKNIGGIVKMSWPIGAIVVVDVKKEASVVKEAVSIGVPVIALIDTNSNPELIDYVIPCNDDSPRSIKVVIDYLAEFARKGSDLAKQNKHDEDTLKNNKAPVATDTSAEALLLLEDQNALQVDIGLNERSGGQKRTEVKPAQNNKRPFVRRPLNKN